MRSFVETRPTLCSPLGDLLPSFQGVWCTGHQHASTEPG